MALDVGDKTIGVAVMDGMGWFAQGVDTIRRIDLDKDIAKIEAFISEYEVGTLVVGLPLRGEGEVGIQAKKVLKFVHEIKKRVLVKHPDLTIEMWDESMTTAEAHEIFAAAGVTSKKRKKSVDKLAALFILESYMRGKDETS